MKRLMVVGAMGLLAWALPATAGTRTAGDVKSAAEKLAEVGNYSWTSTPKSDSERSRRYSGGPTEGKVNKDGIAYLKLTMGERSLEAVVKEQYKLDLSSGLENAILANFYDLFRDTREEWPVSTEVGAWGGAKFVRMVQRHLQRKAEYPDAPPATGMPYAGIDNLRPETKAAVEEFLFMMQTPGM